MSLQLPVNLKLLKNHLENLTSDQFEECIHQLLVIANPHNYRPTPLWGDGGIDGYERKRVGKEKLEYIFYGIHTKRPNPLKVSKKDKIKKDFESAKAYYEDRKDKFEDDEYIFKKFILVSNYVLSEDESRYIEELCNENKIEYDEYHPAKILSLFNTEKKVFLAASCLSYLYLDVPYTALSAHQFTEQALQDICDYKYEKKTTTEKIELLRNIMSTIFKFAFIDKKRPLNIYRQIFSRTEIIPEFIATYTFIDGRFIKKTSSEIILIPIKPYHFMINGNQKYVLFSNSLFPLYKLCLELNEQLESQGDYFIEVALANCYEKENEAFLMWSNMRI